LRREIRQLSFSKLIGRAALLALLLAARQRRPASTEQNHILSENSPLARGFPRAFFFDPGQIAPLPVGLRFRYCVSGDSQF
jgi:hypothetical protein